MAFQLTKQAPLLLVAAVLLGAGPAQALVMQDVAQGAGLDFNRIGSPEVRSDDDANFLEILGGGACWIDYDEDGWYDLYLVNGWLRNETRAEAEDPHSALYRNLGDGTFQDVSRGSGADLRGWTMACSVADYDGDGWEDLFVTGYGMQVLLRNERGNFTDVSQEAGIDSEGKCGQEFPCWGSGAAWADYNGDDCLDLYVINFAEYDLEDDAIGPVIEGREGQGNQLYRSNCDGTFDDVTDAAGASGDPGANHGRDWGVTWLDYNNDRLLDLYTASDGVPNTLLQQRPQGTFIDRAAQANLDDGLNGMGLASGDCNNDGYEDLFFTHYLSGEDPNVQWVGWDGHYVNLQDGTFEQRNGEGDLAVAWPYVGWGTAFVDFDNDGNLDIHEVTGHTSVETDDTDQPMLLWLGNGACEWTDARAVAGPAFETVQSSRGSTYHDYDWDGDVDIVVVNVHSQGAQLVETRDVAGNWLHVQLRQPGANGRALMAEVTAVLPDGTELYRRMNPAQSIHSSNPSSVHFGLGDATAVDLRVRWPDGVVDVFGSVAVNALVALDRTTGQVLRDTVAPITAVVLEGTRGLEGWWTTPVSVSTWATDRGISEVSGVAETVINVDSRQSPDGIVGPGVHALEVFSVDAAGNREHPYRETVRVDVADPVTEARFDGALVDGWFQGGTQMVLSCRDDHSGPAQTVWRVDGGPWQLYEAPVDWARPGVSHFEWSCMDVAGNAEGPVGRTIQVDRPPQTSAVISGPEGLNGWWRGPVDVSLEARTGNAGLVGTEYRLNGGAWSSGTSLVVEGDGVHVLEARSTDELGRVESPESSLIRIDASAPVPRLSDAGPHVWSSQALRVGPHHAILAQAEDDLSGPGMAWVSIDGDPEQLLVEPIELRDEGLHTIRARVQDAAGNEAQGAWLVELDLSPPSSRLVEPARHTVNVGDQSHAVEPWPFSAYAILVGSVPFVIDPGTDASGIDSVRIYVDGRLAARLHEEPWTWVWDQAPGNPDPRVVIQVEDGVGNVDHMARRVWTVGAAEPLMDQASGQAGSLAGWGVLPALPLMAGLVAKRRHTP